MALFDRRDQQTENLAINERQRVAHHRYQNYVPRIPETAVVDRETGAAVSLVFSSIYVLSVPVNRRVKPTLASLPRNRS